jgi:hypothetical protein
MGDSRENILTERLSAYDSKLYAKREHNGCIYVYRKASKIVRFEHKDQSYLYPQESPMFVLALTDNWNVKGKPVDWGIEPLMNRIQEIDAWNRGLTIDAMIQGYEKQTENLARDRHNQNEAWLYDNRSIFKKTFNDTNTSNLNVKTKG